MFFNGGGGMRSSMVLIKPRQEARELVGKATTVASFDARGARTVLIKYGIASGAFFKIKD